MTHAELLRSHADVAMREGGMYYSGEYLSRMADVAESLESENARLRELAALWIVINKHMSLCATTNCGQCPVREECEESVYLEGLLGIDTKGLSWRVQERIADTTDVQAENARLRELVQDMWEGYNDPRCEECHLKDTPTCADCPICAREASVIDRMRELGIEADDG